jgi:uncharacterized cupin superfamily protein
MKILLSSVTVLLAIMATQLQAAPEVLPLSPIKMQQMALDEIPPFPPEVVLKGEQKNWISVLHQGEVIVALYESTAAVIDVNTPFPYDEFVLVLEGEVILTAVNGKQQIFKEGDTFLVPKGWLGTWDMPSHYREMIIVETQAWEAVEG